MLPILGECLQCSYDAVLCSDCLQPGGRHHNHFTNMDEQKLKQKKVAKSKATMEDRKALIAKLLQDKAAKEIEMTRFFDQVHGKLRRAELENMKKLDLIYDNLKLQMDESEEPTVEIKYPKTYIVKLENDEHFQELKFCKNGVEETVATMVNGSPNSTRILPLSPPASPPLVEELDFDLEPTKMKRVTLKKSTSEESGVCDDQIRIVHVENPSTFWVQRFKDVGKITAMEKLLQQKHKAGVLTTIEPDDLKKGLRCVVQRRGIHFERNDGQWLRVQILLVDANTVHVEHLDQGIKAKYDLKKTEFYYVKDGILLRTQRSFCFWRRVSYFCRPVRVIQRCPSRLDSRCGSGSRLVRYCNGSDVAPLRVRYLLNVLQYTPCTLRQNTYFSLQTLLMD